MSLRKLGQYMPGRWKNNRNGGCDGNFLFGQYISVHGDEIGCLSKLSSMEKVWILG